MDARSRKIRKLKIPILQFKFAATAALKKLRSKVLLLAGDSVPIIPANWPPLGIVTRIILFGFIIYRVFHIDDQTGLGLKTRLSLYLALTLTK